MNQNGFIQPKIPQQAEVNVYRSFLIDLNPLNNPSKLCVRHLPHICDFFDFVEGTEQHVFQLFAPGQAIGYHFQLVFQTLDFLPHPADLVVQLFAGDQVVVIHVHIFLTGLSQLRKLSSQFLFIIQVLILCFVDPLEFFYHVLNNVPFRLHNLRKVVLQGLDELRFIHCDRIRADIRTVSIMRGAYPADVGVFIPANCAPEGTPALPAFDKRRKQVFIALTFLLLSERVATCIHDLLRRFKGLRADNPQFRPVGNHPFRFVLFRAPAGQEISNLLLAVYDPPHINFVGQDAADTRLAPLAVPLRACAAFVQKNRNFGSSVTVFNVPLVNLTDDGRFLGIDLQVEIIANGLVVAVDDIRDAPLFRVDPLAEFHALRGVRAFLLRQCAENRQHKLTVAHAGHVRGQELRFNSQRLQLADALQQVDRIPGKAGDVLNNNHVKKPLLSVLHHPQELPAVFYFCPGNPLVGIQADKMIPRPGGIFRKKFFLRLQAVQLIGCICGNTAICGNLHYETFPLIFNRSVISLFYHGMNANTRKHSARYGVFSW